MTVPDVEPGLYGVLVTYQRPAELTTALARVATQTLRLRRLVVVDNEPSAANEEAVRGLADQVEYLPAAENLGPAGGLAAGMERILRVARDEDWIVTLDDDDPPLRDDLFEILWTFARERVEHDPMTAAVGVAGTRFDRGRGARRPRRRRRAAGRRGRRRVRRQPMAHVRRRRACARRDRCSAPLLRLRGARARVAAARRRPHALRARRRSGSPAERNSAGWALAPVRRRRSVAPRGASTTASAT